MAESSSEPKTPDSENIFKNSRCLRQCLRVQNAKLQNLLEEEKFSEEYVGNILKRKHELTDDLKQTINLCEECKNYLEKLEIANLRQQKGRHQLEDRDSGIGSIVSKDLEGQDTETGIHAQDTTAHTHPEAAITSTEDHSTNDKDDTDC